MTWQLIINHILSLFSLAILGITIPALFVAIKHVWKKEDYENIIKEQT